MLTMDCFACHPKIAKLTKTTSSAIIFKLKEVFAQHVINEIVSSNNAPQFSAQEIVGYAYMYEFTHVGSSKQYSQSNGQIERMVQTMKNFSKNAEAPHLAVLSYCATPHPC